MGESFKIHQYTLANDETQAFGLAQIFIFIAHDTLKHLKVSNRRVLKTTRRTQSYKEVSVSRTEAEIHARKLRESYLKQYYRFSKPDTTIVLNKISRKRLDPNQKPYQFLKAEWERKGFWRRVYCKETGRVKKRVWVSPTTVTPGVDKLKSEIIINRIG